MTAQDARLALATDAPVRARVTLDFPTGYAWGNPDLSAVEMVVHIVGVEGDYGLAWAAVRLPGDRDTKTFPSDYAHLPLDRLDPMTDDRVREILRRDNVTEPGGDWSVFDIARELDPQARKPRGLFDTGRDTWPRDEYVEIATAAVTRIEPSARYVGGTSNYLYSLPREEG